MGIALIITLQALLDGVKLCSNYRAVQGVQLTLETCLDLVSPSSPALESNGGTDKTQVEHLLYLFSPAELRVPHLQGFLGPAGQNLTMKITVPPAESC